MMLRDLREPRGAQVAQQGVHRRRPRSGGPAHGIPDPDDRGYVPAGERHLRIVGHAPVSGMSASSR
jgi:hypothetical protein